MPNLKDLFDNLYAEIQNTKIVNHEASALDKKLYEQNVVEEITEEMKKILCLIEKVGEKIDLLTIEHTKFHVDSSLALHVSKECLEYENEVGNLSNKNHVLGEILWLLSGIKVRAVHLRNDWKLVDVSNPDDELKKLLEEFYNIYHLTLIKS